MKNFFSSRWCSWMVLYAVGVGVGFFVTLLRKTGYVKIVHGERLFSVRKKGGVILCPNHPSALETVIIPALCLREYIFNPRKIPWSTPDKHYIYMNPFCFFARPRMIPIDRRKKSITEVRKTFSEIEKILLEGGRVTIFPEGMRTFKAERAGRVSYSSGGKPLADLKRGVILLAKKTDALILPIWVEGTDKILPNKQFPLPRPWAARIVIKVGEGLRVSDKTVDEGYELLKNAYFELADEEN